MQSPRSDQNPNQPIVLTPQRRIRRGNFGLNIMNKSLELDEEAWKEANGDKLPKAYKKSPPEFDGESPDNLVPWLETCERLFASAGVKVDAAKKYLALEWMSYKTRMEWQDHPEIVKNTVSWETFKDILKSGYPESSSYKSGSKARLIKLVKDAKPIRRSEEQKLQHFVRRFKLESGKLMKGSRPVLSNNEAVKWFLFPLEDSFKTVVLEKIEIDVSLDNEPRRPDDLFTLDEVIQSAVRLSQLWKGYNLSLEITEESAPRAKVTVKTEPTDEWSRKISLSEDRHDVQLKEQAQKIDSLAKGIAKMQAAFEKGMRPPQASIPVNSQSPSMGSVSTSYGNRTYTVGDMVCYFCREKGHGTKSCPSFLELLEKGILVKKEGTNMHMLKDGGFIPKDDERGSKKEKVVRIAQEKGWLNENYGVHFYEDPGDNGNNIQFLQETDSLEGLDQDLINLARQLQRAMMLVNMEEDQTEARDTADARSKNC